MMTKFKYIVLGSLLFGLSGFNSAKAITADELLNTIVVPLYTAVIQAFTQIGQVLGDHETRISDGDARIAPLESDLAANAILISSMQAQVDQLQVQNAGLDSGDLTGSIYCFINVGDELTGSNSGYPPGIYSSHSKGVMTFTSSTQVSILDGGDVDASLYINTGVLRADAAPGGTSEVFSYSVTGNVLTIFEGWGEASLYITPDANLLLSDDAGIEDDGGNYGANMRIAVRADSC